MWCAPGRNAQTLQAFFDLLGERRHSIQAVSIDMSGGYETAIRDAIPDAEICCDPFHVVRLAQRAVDQVRRDEWNAHERSHTPQGKWIKGTRWSLLKTPEKQTAKQLALLAEVQHANKPLYRAFLLKEELRVLYQLQDPPSRPRTSTPGSPGRPDPGWTRSSSSRGPSAATATGSWPRSASPSTNRAEAPRARAATPQALM